MSLVVALWYYQLCIIQHTTCIFCIKPGTCSQVWVSNSLFLQSRQDYLFALPPLTLLVGVPLRRVVLDTAFYDKVC